MGYHKTLEASRLEAKLKLWTTPGFFHFIEDLNTMKGPECSIKDEVETIRKIYSAKLRELSPKSKFVQTTLEA